MRKRVFIALLGNLLGAAALALVLAWAVGAQGPEPKGHEPYFGPRGLHPVHPADSGLDRKPAPQLAPSGDLGAQGVSAAVTLGQPGLSFRYVGTFGVTEVPYTSTTDYLNWPIALAVDGAGNVYIAERNGHRVLKYNSAGTFQMQIGYTGLCRVWDDEGTGVCDPRGLAVDTSGKIWVAERGPDRVSIFMPSGTYTGQLGVTGEEGSDNVHFCEPEGVAFDSAGRIYVADSGNNRVQIFASNRTYSATIGGTCGPGNNQFCRPGGLAMGSGNVLYVADDDNARVQVYRLVGNRMVYSQSITTTGTINLLGVQRGGGRQLPVRGQRWGRQPGARFQPGWGVQSGARSMPMASVIAVTKPSPHSPPSMVTYTPGRGTTTAGRCGAAQVHQVATGTVTGSRWSATALAARTTAGSKL